MIDFKKKMEELEKQEARESGQEEFVAPINKKRKKITAYVIAVVVIGLVFSSRVIMSSQNASGWLAESGLFNKIKHLVPSTDKQLKGEENDRINIVLLGMGGEGHDGAYLSDTIMLASLKPSTKQVALVSVPRDLQVPLEEAGYRKINNINAFAEAKEPGSGGQATIDALSKLFNLNIDYYVRVDFAGFENVIDELGGVTVNVENTLDDYAYPILGQEDNPDYYARYEHLHIDKGIQTMDGELALKYARSRHGIGGEGSDFARAKRQQLILEAVKEKLLSKQTLLNPVTIGKLISQFSQHVSTNFSVWEILRAWDLFKGVDKNQIINQVLSDAPDGLLISTISSEGAYILVPAAGNFSKINALIRDIFNNNQATTPIEKVEKISEDASITVKNGTWISGLAGATAANLQELGLTVKGTGNAPERGYTETLVFDFTYGKKNEALEAIKKATGAEQGFDTSTPWIKEYQEQANVADFLLILGTDANTTN
ncbi:MAG: LCP family protein [Candidatus Falkowbacteria bacterium]|nr:MAG: LCP family protein [Candidatus Falkowbacteria bacterium]